MIMHLFKIASKKRESALMSRLHYQFSNASQLVHARSRQNLFGLTRQNHSTTFRTEAADRYDHNMAEIWSRFWCGITSAAADHRTTCQWSWREATKDKNKSRPCFLKGMCKYIKRTNDVQYNQKLFPNAPEWQPTRTISTRVKGEVEVKLESKKMKCASFENNFKLKRSCSVRKNEWSKVKLESKLDSNVLEVKCRN